MRVRLSADARRDLTGVCRYSAKRWDEVQGDRYVRLITDSFDGLARGSVRGRNADDIRPGYFKLAAGSHVVFYRIADASVIEVIRILHRRMDFEQHL